MKTTTLYSLNPEEYPNIEMSFEETTAAESTNFANPEIIKAKKTAPVQAEKLTEDRVVDTRPRVEHNGNYYTFSETKNTAPAGSWVITNPDGEQYVIKDKVKYVKDGNGNIVEENGHPKTEVITADSQFTSKYAPAENGLYVATESGKTFQQVTSNICFEASWGELQFVPAGSYVCTAYGPGEEYGVTNSAFDATYEIETLVAGD